MPSSFDPYFKWLGIPAEEQPPDHYRLLGIPKFTDDPDVIESAADRQTKHVRDYQSGQHADLSQTILNELSAAKVVLLTPEKKAAYDARLKNEEPVSPPTPQPLRVAAPLTPPEAPPPTVSGGEVEPESVVGVTPITSTGKARRPKSNMLITAVVGVGIALVLLALVSAALFWPKPTTAIAVEENPTNSAAAPAPPPTPRVVAETPHKEPSPPVESPPVETSADENPKTSSREESDTAQEESAADDATRLAVAPATADRKVEDDSPGKPIAPNKAEREAAAKEVLSVFGKEIDSAQTDDQKRALAEKMLKVGQRTKDLSVRFALYEQAMDTAKSIPDVPLALAAVDRLDQTFEGDALRLKAILLNEITRRTPRGEGHVELAPHFDALLDEAIASDRFDIATPLAEVALDSAVDSRDIELRKQAVKRNRKVERLANSHSAATQAAKRLKNDPDDPDANLVVGKYFCFSRERWEEGLSYLAKGSDDRLARLAKAEIDVSTDAASLGDDWWEVADETEEDHSDAIRKHAAEFYRRAMPTLDGFARTKVEKRLGQLQEPIPYIDLFNRLDVERDAAFGVWKFDGRILTTGYAPPKSRDDPPYLLRLPFLPTDDYEISVTVIPQERLATFWLMLPVGDHGVNVVVDGRVAASGLAMVDGKGYHENETTHKGALLIPGKENTITCRVHRQEITLTCNGKQVFRFAGDLDRLAAPPKWDKHREPGTAYIAGTPTPQMKFVALRAKSSSPHDQRRTVDVNLLAKVELDRDVVGGKWRWQGSLLIAEGGKNSSLRLPQELPDRFRLEMLVEARGNGWLIVGPLLLDQGASEGYFSAILDGRKWKRVLKGRMLPRNHGVSISFEVNDDHLEITRYRKEDGNQTIYDGKVRFNWDSFRVIAESQVDIHKIHLTELGQE